MEYTITALVAAGTVVLLDHVLGTRLVRKSGFWLFVAVMFGFKLLVNGYLTARPIVEYGAGYHLGIRLGTIPVEDFIYGFGLLTLSVVLWEHFLAQKSRSKRKAPVDS